jgi:SH3-like domain-containing protein
VTPSKLRISPQAKITQILLSGLILIGILLGMMSSAAMAGEVGITHGRETGLPLPRFVSLKFNKVNLRVGPGRKYTINWLYKKRGLPVEIIQEFDQWRRIRDSEGTTGWVLNSQLSSRRTGIIAPWEKPKIDFGDTVRAAFINGKGAASNDSGTVAKLQAGLMVSIGECEAKWCEVEAQDTRFWLQQDHIWGVYPGETVDG